ncbi:hypothetical protein V8C86DRAFT_3032196, partial [Haematococcus lacustris]
MDIAAYSISYRGLRRLLLNGDKECVPGELINGKDEATLTNQAMDSLMTKTLADPDHTTIKLSCCPPPCQLLPMPCLFPIFFPSQAGAKDKLAFMRHTNVHMCAAHSLGVYFVRRFTSKNEPLYVHDRDKFTKVPLISGSDEGKSISYWTMHREFTGLFEAFGLGLGKTTHAPRHGGSKGMQERGLDKSKIAQHCGWDKSTAVTNYLTDLLEKDANSKKWRGKEHPDKDIKCRVCEYKQLVELIKWFLATQCPNVKDKHERLRLLDKLAAKESCSTTVSGLLRWMRKLKAQQQPPQPQMAQLQTVPTQAATASIEVLERGSTKSGSEAAPSLYPCSSVFAAWRGTGSAWAAHPHCHAMFQMAAKRINDEQGRRPIFLPLTCTHHLRAHLPCPLCIKLGPHPFTLLPLSLPFLPPSPA